MELQGFFCGFVEFNFKARLSLGIKIFDELFYGGYSITSYPSRDFLYTRKHLSLKDQNAILVGNEHFFDKEFYSWTFAIGALGVSHGSAKLLGRVNIPGHSLC